MTDAPTTQPAPTPTPPEPVSLAAILRTTLARRWHWALAASLLAGAGAAWFVHRAIDPKFQSVGVVRVDPFAWDQEELLPRYESFRYAEANRIESEDGRQLIADSEVWDALPADVREGVAERVASTIVIGKPKGEETLLLVSESTDPEWTHLGVLATVDAYQTLRAALEEQERRKRLDRTDAQIAVADGRITDLQAQLNAVANGASVETLRTQRSRALQAMIRADAQLEALRTGTPMTPEAGGDPLVALASEIAVKRLELANASRTLGQNHRTIRELNGELENLERLYEELARNAPSEPTPTPTIALSADEIRERAEAARQTVADLDAQISETEALSGQIAEARANRGELLASRDEVEAVFTSQPVEVIGRPSPGASINDTQRVRKAAIAGLVGASGMLGLFVGLGLIDRRIRVLEHVQGGLLDLPLLGVMPAVPERMGVDDAYNTAMRIQDLRVMVQHRLRRTGGHSVSLTSSEAETGKTSLTLAMGISLARSGNRVLLIDFDTVGQRLTERVEPMLVRHVVHPDDHGRTQRYHVRHTAVHGLDIVPVAENAAASVSRVMFEAMLAEVASRYDVVLVDTGPISGSADASIACAATDEVLLLVAPGQDRRLLQSAAQKLQLIGANVMGYVFNRAIGRDADRFGSSYSTGTSRRKKELHADATRELDKNHGLGPLAAATIAVHQADEAA